jgi:hypothetical protein
VASDPIAPLIAKLDRADETMRAFDEEMRAIGHDKPLRVRIDVDFQSGWSTADVLDTQPIPLIVGVLVGESLYHARSTLEHLVWALVKANHKKPGEHNSFPVEITRRKRPFMEYHWREPAGRDLGGKLRGVSKRAGAVIESLQPYHRPNASEHFLAVLDAMAKDDRHRSLHGSHTGGRGPDYAGIVDLEPIFVPTRGYRIVEFRNLLRHGKGLVPGTKLARFRVDPLARNNKVGVKGDIPTFIAFGNRETGFIFAQDFKRINASLRKVLGLFQEFL